MRWVLIASAAALAACQPTNTAANDVPELRKILSGHYAGGMVSKGCDHGRAIYVVEGDGMAIAIIENAPECNAKRSPDPR